MNPIMTWVMAHTVSKALSRKCPKCGHRQIVPREKARESVACKSCGTPIPPKAKLAR